MVSSLETPSVMQPPAVFLLITCLLKAAVVLLKKTQRAHGRLRRSSDRLRLHQNQAGAASAAPWRRAGSSRAEPALIRRSFLHRRLQEQTSGHVTHLRLALWVCLPAGFTRRSHLHCFHFSEPISSTSIDQQFAHLCAAGTLRPRSQNRTRIWRD